MTGDTVVTTGDYTGDGRADIGGQHADGTLRAWAATGNLAADDAMFTTTTAIVGTGWTTTGIIRIV